MKYKRRFKHVHFLHKKYLLGVYSGGRNIFQQEFSKKKPRSVRVNSDNPEFYTYEPPIREKK